MTTTTMFKPWLITPTGRVVDGKYAPQTSREAAVELAAPIEALDGWRVVVETITVVEHDEARLQEMAA